MDLKDCLTEVIGTPAELDRMWASGYYDYLSSPAFLEAFHRPTGVLLYDLGVRTVLDVGCGDGAFGRAMGEFLDLHCYGFDWSEVALGKARDVGYTRVVYGKLDSPPLPDTLHTANFDAVLLNNLMSVLVRPSCRTRFARLYAERYKVRYVVVTDMVHMEWTPPTEWRPLGTWTARAAIKLDPPVKEHRRAEVYRVGR